MIPIYIPSLLNNYRAHHLMRERHIIQRDEDHVVIQGKSCLHFCSNDYLSISHHPEIKKAFIRGVNEHGLGSGGSPCISGYSKSHYLLEVYAADILQRERALLFNSGYHANLGVITTFANRNSLIVADKYCHASLIDGAILSRTTLHRYDHEDVKHAEMLLNRSVHKPNILITESVFSIKGSIADVKKLASLAAKYQSFFIVDDAHGIGVLGDEGGGICEHFHVSQNEIPCLITPLGKGAGSMGAVVSGGHEMIEALLQLARTYRYSTAMPAALCHATIAALCVMKKESWRREKLKHNIRFFISEAKKRELSLSSTDLTPIKSIVIGSNKLTMLIQRELTQQGFFVSCIRSPTVPKNEACLRISLNCNHREQDITQLLDHLKHLLSKAKSDESS